MKCPKCDATTYTSIGGGEICPRCGYGSTYMTEQSARQQQALDEYKCFQSLSQAIAFIAELIERNAASELMAQFAHIQRPPPTQPDDCDFFTNSIFPQLRKYHQETDFRARYKGMHFPSNETRFTLGGHMKELGCIHIDFARQEQGWVLESVWECK